MKEPSADYRGFIFYSIPKSSSKGKILPKDFSIFAQTLTTITNNEF
jgi:hypothetical protein